MMLFIAQKFYPLFQSAYSIEMAIETFEDNTTVQNLLFIYFQPIAYHYIFKMDPNALAYLICYKFE